jgi:riboflavin kinase/FMN adenylyltransferase
MKGDLYGKRIKVEFLTKLRDEQKFDGLEALVAAIQKDAEKASAFVANRLRRLPPPDPDIDPF